MGLSSGRLDEISGKESVDLYYEYLRCPDPELKESLMKKILLHNHDDLVQLYRILPVIKQTDLHSAMFSLGFPVKGEGDWPNLTVRKLNLSTKNLTVSGILPESRVGYTAYAGFSSPEQCYDCTIESDGSFQFTVPIEKLRDSLFINVKELLGDTSALEILPGHVNGFLILCQNNKRNPLEINMLARELLVKFMRETPFI